MPHTSQVSNTSRITNLQSLRFIFILMVFASHIDWGGNKFDYGGECGVSFFFILSGFVLSIGYGKRIEQNSFNRNSFLKKQIIKIYPLHLLTMATVLVLNARIGQYDNPFLLIVHILLLQSWLPDESYYFVTNSLSWFLSDILFFYIMFPFLYRKLTVFTRQKLAISILAVMFIWLAIALSIQEKKVNAILYASPATRLIDFSIGIILYRVYKSSIGLRIVTFFNSHRNIISIIEFISAAVIFATFFVYEMLPTRFRCTALFWFVMPAFILLFTIFSTNGGVISNLLQRKWMLWLGDISFEIYMTHCIVMRVIQSCLHNIGGMEYITGFNLFCTAVPLTVITSHIVKRYFVDKIVSFYYKTNHTRKQKKI